MVKRFTKKTTDADQIEKFIKKYYAKHWIKEYEVCEKSEITYKDKNNDPVTILTGLNLSQPKREGSKNLVLRVSQQLRIPSVAIVREQEVSLLAIKDNSELGAYYDGLVVGLINEDNGWIYALTEFEKDKNFGKEFIKG